MRALHFVDFGTRSFATLAIVVLAGGGCGGSTEAAFDPSETAGGDSENLDVTLTEASGLDGATDDTSTNDTPFDETSVSDSADAGEVGTCRMEGSHAACISCCAARDPEGQKILNSAIVSCACTASACKAECATTGCATPAKAANKACAQCVTLVLTPAKGDAGADAGGREGSCDGPVGAACSLSAKCKAYFACTLTCPKA